MSPSGSGTSRTSRRQVPIFSLGDSLMGHPLVALGNIIPKGYTHSVGLVLPKRFNDILIHHQLSVRAPPPKLGFGFLFL